MLPTIVPAVLRPVTALHGRPGDEPRSTIVRPSEAKAWRSEEHTSELQSQSNLVCRLLLEKKKKTLPPFLNLQPRRPTTHTIYYSSPPLSPQSPVSVPPTHYLASNHARIYSDVL